LVGSDFRLHCDQLLGRAETGSGAVTLRKVTAPRWLRLSIVQDRATGW